MSKTIFFVKKLSEIIFKISIFLLKKIFFTLFCSIFYIEKFKILQKYCKNFSKKKGQKQKWKKISKKKAKVEKNQINKSKSKKKPISKSKVWLQKLAKAKKKISKRHLQA